jgi:hypothetical protein
VYFTCTVSQIIRFLILVNLQQVDENNKGSIQNL